MIEQKTATTASIFAEEVGGAPPCLLLLSYKLTFQASLLAIAGIPGATWWKK